MGFILKLWRGEVSLGTTYWIFGALIVFMFEAFEMATAALPEGGSDIPLFVGTAYYLFIGVAILRSSFRYQGSRSFRFFAQLTAISLFGTVLWRIFAYSVAGPAPLP